LDTPRNPVTQVTGICLFELEAELSAVVDIFVDVSVDSEVNRSVQKTLSELFGAGQ
jgi:hypothetical protein